MSGIAGNGRVACRAWLVTVTLGAAGFLCACGDGGGDSGATTPPGTNHAPTISGAPLTSVMQNQAYTFTPAASDSDNDALTFSITNKPPWATFAASNGRLSGTPTQGDVGTSSNIQISVSDGMATASLPAFNVQVVATALGSVTLNWTIPTQNTDGSPLTDLAGFKIYWGTSAGSYPNSVTLSNPGLTTAVIDQLTPATWYFAATAYNSQNVESTLSNPASKTIQ